MARRWNAWHPVLLATTVKAWLTHPRLMRRHWREFGYLPHVAFPRTYPEKMLWRKLFDRNPLFVTFCDKLAAKAFAAERCPELPTARVLWTGTRAEDIPDAVLQGDVVVKANNGCKFNLFIANGAYDRNEVERKARGWLATTYGASNAEWAYSAVPPKLLVEERLPLGHPSGATDITIHVCNGVIVHGALLDEIGSRAHLFDREGAWVDARPRAHLLDSQVLPSHPALGDAFREAAPLARTLGRDIDYCRFDFLLTLDRMFFGEATIYPGSGYSKWSQPGVAARLAAMWDIRKSHFLGSPAGGLRGLYARTLRRVLDRENRQ